MEAKNWKASSVNLIFSTPLSVMQPSYWPYQRSGQWIAGGRVHPATYLENHVGRAEDFSNEMLCVPERQAGA